MSIRTDLMSMQFMFRLLCLYVGFIPVAGAQQSDPADSLLNPVEVAEKITVTTRLLSDVWFEQTMRASAEAVSLNHPQISAQATGEVMSIEVETGDQLEKGQVMVRLDCRQSEFNQAVLNDAYALALKEFKRSRSLQKNNAISEQQVTQATSTLEQASIRKQQAELSVEHCLIIAPFDGVVTERQIQLGAVAVPGSPVLTLLQTDAVEVRVRLTREELASLEAAAEIQFISENRIYPLVLRSVLPVIDSVSNKRAVRLSVVGDAPFPGAPGDVMWQSEGKYLPVELIVERENDLGYFVEEQGEAHFLPLSGARLGHPARINSDKVNAGRIKVIVEGRFRLEQGSRISAQLDSEDSGQ